MAIRRTGTTKHADVATLVAETVVPQDNDETLVEAIGAYGTKFRFRNGETAADDGKYVVDQTSATALGRWVRDGVSAVLSGTVTAEAIPDGAQGVYDITVAGLVAGDPYAYAFTTNGTPANADGDAADVQFSVDADNTVHIVITNNTGKSIVAAAHPFNVHAL